MSLFESMIKNKMSYSDAVTKKQEEEAQKRREQQEERKKLITQSIQEKKSIFSNNRTLPVSKEFKQQLEKGNRVQAKEDESLSIFAKSLKKNALQEVAKNVGNTLLEDSGNILSNLITGFGKSAKQSAKYIESANENNFSDYKNKRTAQYLASPNVSEEEKASYKQQNNLLLPTSSKNKIETNLIKRGIQESIDKDNEKIEKNIKSTSNPITKKLSELTPSIGQSAYGMVASTINPILGSSAFMTSAGGEYIDDAKKRGMNDKEAFTYGTVMGELEGVTESIGAHLTKSIGKNILKGNTKDALKSFGLDLVENVAEESIMEPLSETSATVIGGKETADWSDIGKRMIESGIDGGLTALIMGGASAGIGSSINIVNKIYEGQTINQNEINMAKQDINNRITEQQVQQKLQEAQDIINNLQNGQGQANNTTNLQTQQTIQQENKTAQNQTSEQLKSNIIDEKVNQYIAQNRENFTSDINIETKVVNENNANNVNYKNQSEFVIYSKAKSLFQNLHKRVFKNNNQNIYVTNADIKESIEKTIKNPRQNKYINENLAVFSQLDKIIENAELIAGEKLDNKGRIEYSDYEYYVSKVNIDGQPYIVEFDTRLQNGTSGKAERHFRLERVYNIKEVTSATGTDYSINQFGTDVTLFTNSITSSNENVKPTNYSMQNEQNNTQNVAPTVENNVVDTEEYTKQKANNQNNTQNTEKTKGETINWNDIKRPENSKFRKHYQSIIQSSNTTAQAKLIAKEMMGLDTYVPQSNIELLQKADLKISATDANTELNLLYSKVMNNEKVNDVDIAVGERLIEYYSKIGDSKNLLDAIHTTAMAGTQAGRTVQAMALLNHMTPQGQLVWLQRSIDKMNNELQQKYKNKKNIQQFQLTEEMTNKILNTETNQELFNALDEVYNELGNQVPKTFWEQIDEWRYFSMLANLKTHARNMIGNLAMGGVQRVKNKVAGVIEGTVAKFNPDMERTHTIRKSSQKTKEFAKNDVKNIDVQTELGMNENKYNPQSRLQNARKTFKTDALNKTIGELYNLNSNALEIEDNIGLKSMYVNALSEYITANKIDVDNITDVQLAKARQHAIKEAQEATFHQASALSTALNQMGRKNNITKFFLDATVPFKKTPINVAKTGIQYSPVGLIKSAVLDVGKVRKGNMTINQYIDNVSKGLTGTGITLLGYALAEAGILKASGGDDDKKEQYDEEQGKQAYSIEIGGKSLSLDWLSPIGISLFIGAEINQLFKNSKKEKTSKSTDDEELLNQAIRKVGDIGTAFSNAMNPMTEMSMLSGLTSVLSSYNKENALGNIIVNSGKSYVNQFVPTALGQLARTTDKYERTTTSTKTGTLPRAIDSTINQVKSKIPGLRQTLPIKTNIWGKEIKQSENLPFRAFNNFINPSIVKDISADEVDKELNNLYSKTKESSIIPKSIAKTFTIDGQDYRMTNKEYAKYNELYGKTSYNLIKGLVNSKDYTNLDNKQKQIAIEKAYEYAKEQIKIDYAKNNNLEYKESKLSKTLNTLKKSNGNTSNYLEYISLTKDIDKTSEKITILANSNFTDKTKQLIYENYIKSENDTEYSVMKVAGINITEYLKYKQQEFKSDKNDDGTLAGKTVTKSKQKKVESYLNSMKITGNQRLLLYAMQGYSTTSSQKTQLANYVYNLKLTKEEKLKLYDKFSGFTVYKDGRVTW